MSYQLHLPRTIWFGWDVRHRVAEVAMMELQLARPPWVLVCGPGRHYHTLIDELSGQLGAPLAIYRGITPDPLLSDVDGLLEVLRAQPPALVVAAGGGSAMDVAKAGAAIAPFPGTTADYFFGDLELSAPGIPLVALPTTAGTGTEMTRNAVLTDPATKVKQSIRHPGMLPMAALVDPGLTLGLPPSTTASCGLDALTQAVESYLSNQANDVTRALALKATQLILNALPKAYAKGTDPRARADMAEGSMITGMAFANSGLGAVHGLAHPLGALLDTQHGYTCAIILPYILDFNAPQCAARLDELAQATGRESGAQFIAHIKALCHQLQIPSSFRGHGLTADHFPLIVERCRSNSMKCNPRPMADEDVLAVLELLAK